MSFEHLLAPIRIGRMELRNRVMVPPHATRVGDLWGSPGEVESHLGYWEARGRAGAAWINGLVGHLGNAVPPGFEPTGVGNFVESFFRRPLFIERATMYADAVHATGAYATMQIVKQGGTPLGPSSTMSAPIVNVVPHVLGDDEIRTILAEYRFAAEQIALTPLDGVELHINHDDILEWFMSPATNQRTDAYGGSLENRLRLTLEALAVLREVLGPEAALGVRMNLYQDIPGGYPKEDGIAFGQLLEQSGLVDYLNVVMGSAWGNPAYIQPHYVPPAYWASAVGELKRAVGLPIVHAGRLTTPEVAEQVLRDGHADVVGLARAHLADPDILIKVREGRTDEIRPCVAGNECISRHYVEGLGFACAVNPDVGHEREDAARDLPLSKSVIVVGAGPAGMEFAASAAELGHRVTLWEAEPEVGGQLRIAARAPGYTDFDRYLRWQERRLTRLGVELVRGRRAVADELIAHEADEVVIATGAVARRPRIPGIDGPRVLEGRDILTGAAVTGGRVAVIAQEDHMAPLAIADFLGEQGHDVTLLYSSVMPAPLLSRYMIGTVLGRLDLHGVEVRCTTDVMAVEDDALVLRHVFSNRLQTVSGFDSIVLACGGLADDALHQQLSAAGRPAHLLGDAYAPRRLVYATRQARALSLEF